MMKVKRIDLYNYMALFLISKVEIYDKGSTKFDSKFMENYNAIVFYEPFTNREYNKMPIKQ